MTRTPPATFAVRKSARLCAGITSLFLTVGLIATVQAPANADTGATDISTIDEWNTVLTTIHNGDSVVAAFDNSTISTWNAKDLGIQDGQTVDLDLNGGTLNITSDKASVDALGIAGGGTFNVSDGTLNIHGANGADGTPGYGLSGGAGGPGVVVMAGGTLTGDIVTIGGGSGGQGSLATSGRGGAGGSGGEGVYLAGTVAANSLTATGGSGGRGGQGATGMRGSTAFPGSGKAGGQGGPGGAGGTGGTGGTAMEIFPTTLAVAGTSTITGGQGGTGGVGGQGGPGGAGDGSGATGPQGTQGAGGNGGSGGLGASLDPTVTTNFPTLGGARGPGGAGSTEGFAGTDGAVSTNPGLPATEPVTLQGGAAAGDREALLLYGEQQPVAVSRITVPAEWGSWDGKTLNGWATALGGRTLKASDTVLAPALLYANWKADLPPSRPGTQPIPQPPFLDVPFGAPFEPDIAWLKNQGITTGYQGNLYKPTAPITREAVAAFLYRRDHDGMDAPTPTAAPFPNVPLTNRFAGDIEWLKNEGVTTGFADGGFHPTARNSRAAAAAFFYRAAHDGQNAAAPQRMPFPDVPTTERFAGDVAWLKTQHITTGYPDGTYRPGNPITREAIAAFLHRAATS